MAAHERSGAGRLAGEVFFAGFDLDDFFLGENAGGEAAAHGAGGVDAERPLQAADSGAGGVAVDDERRAFPERRPMRALGRFGAFARSAVVIDILDTGDDPRRLAAPGLVGKEAAVDEDDVVRAIVIRERHGLHVGPVAGRELLERIVVVFLEMRRIAGFAVVEEAELVIAEEGEVGVLAGERNHLGAVGAAVDEISEEDDAVVAFELEFLEQIFEFAMATVDIADGDEASSHRVGF